MFYVLLSGKSDIADMPSQLIDHGLLYEVFLSAHCDVRSSRVLEVPFRDAARYFWPSGSAGT
jgi:hypothetical protein